MNKNLKIGLIIPDRDGIKRCAATLNLMNFPEWYTLEVAVEVFEEFKNKIIFEIVDENELRNYESN